MGEPNQIDLEVLASTTLSLSTDALTLYGARRKELISIWTKVFDKYRNPETGAIDWFRLRKVFRDNILEETLDDELFRDGFRSICFELLTPAEGNLGERILFASRG